MKKNKAILRVDDPKGDKFKQTLIGQLLSTPGGRSKLARSLAHPLKTRIDYSSIARKVFSVEPLPEGDLPAYEKKKDGTIRRRPKRYILDKEKNNNGLHKNRSTKKEVG